MSSESESPPFATLRELDGAFLGVFCTLCTERYWAGEAGEEGGDDRCVGTRAKRAFLTVGGGVKFRSKVAFGERSLFNERYGLFCAVVRVERRGE